jgi:folate-binding protein YgfZ
MNEAWSAALAARGAAIDGDTARSFGDPGSELAATASGSVLADLSHLGVLGFGGDDSRAFLQTQLSCDVAALGADSSTFGAYCSPKGRMLASFLLWPTPSGFEMALARGLAPAIEKRLRQYVLRAKVVVADRTTDYAVFGIAGPAARPALEAATGAAATQPHRVTRGAGTTAIAMPGDRFLLVVAAGAAAGLWDALARTLRPVGTPCWHWLDIRSGIPLVTPATHEAFVPQMTNLELLGGVSFQKGCYPGQEVVARTQYLGKSKRRMFRAHVDVEAFPGDELFSEDLGDQASGTIVSAAPSPEGGFEVLAVAPTASVAASVVHLRSLDGPPLRFLALPYAVP